MPPFSLSTHRLECQIGVPLFKKTGGWPAASGIKPSLPILEVDALSHLRCCSKGTDNQFLRFSLCQQKAYQSGCPIMQWQWGKCRKTFIRIFCVWSLIHNRCWKQGKQPSGVFVPGTAVTESMCATSGRLGAYAQCLKTGFRLSWRQHCSSAPTPFTAYKANNRAGMRFYLPTAILSPIYGRISSSRQRTAVCRLHNTVLRLHYQATTLFGCRNFRALFAVEIQDFAVGGKD